MPFSQQTLFGMVIVILLFVGGVYLIKFWVNYILMQLNEALIRAIETQPEIKCEKKSNT